MTASPEPSADRATPAVASRSVASDRTVGQAASRSRRATALDRYLDAADSGRGGAARVATTVGCVLLANIAATVAALFAARTAGLDPHAGASLAVLAGVAAQGPAVAIAVVFVHRRSLASLWGGGGVDWRGALRGAAVGFIISAASACLFFAFGLVEFSWRAGSEPAGRWAILAGAAALVPLAAAAEELLYRGYAAQACRRWPRRPAIYAAPGILLFAASHYTGDVAAFLAFTPFLMAFAVVATASVTRTGGLSEASGLHIGWNVCALFVFTAAEAPLGIGIVSVSDVETPPPAAAVIAPAVLAFGYLAMAAIARTSRRPA